MIAVLGLMVGSTAMVVVSRAMVVGGISVVSSITAKCVRWSHSHTVTLTSERLSFLEHPLSDHSPILRDALL